MDSDKERDAFLDEIITNPEDTATKKIFADWLDDHDCPEEADFYREWSLDKYRESLAWMKGFSTNYLMDIDNDTDQLCTPEVRDVVEAARRYVREGYHTCISGQGFSSQECFMRKDEQGNPIQSEEGDTYDGWEQNEELLIQFWLNWQVLAGEYIPLLTLRVEDSQWGHPFTCCRSY